MLTAVLVAACSSDVESGSDGQAAKIGPATGVDDSVEGSGPAGDAGAAPVGESAASDDGMPHLVKKGNVHVRAITDDGNVIYDVMEGAHLTLQAVSLLQRGDPLILSSDLRPIRGNVMTMSGAVVASGPAVGFWTEIKDVDRGQDYVGTLSVWTRANGVKVVSTTSSNGQFAASSDGSRIAYSTGANATTQRIVIGDSSAASTPTTVVSGVALGFVGDRGCKPHYAFGGTTLFLASCGPTSAQATARVLTKDSKTPVTLSTKAFGVTLNTMTIGGLTIAFPSRPLR